MVAPTQVHNHHYHANYQNMPATLAGSPNASTKAGPGGGRNV